MKVIEKKPGQKPEVVEIENTLSALQAAVGGMIQAVPLTYTSCVICNEMGWLEGAPYNTTLHGTEYSGPILIVGVDMEDFTGLTDEQIASIIADLEKEEG